ncbi:MAG: acyl-CoA thioesterase [Acidiferrobacterales bacterium]
MAEPAAYKHEVYVGLSSVDRAGVLFYGELFRYAHDTYEAFMRRLDESLTGVFEKGQVVIPVAHAEADFIRPLHHGDTITVQLRVRRIGRSSITFGYEFLGPGAELCARAQTVHVFVDRKSGQATAVPSALREKLQQFVR